MSTITNAIFEPEEETNRNRETVLRIAREIEQGMTYAEAEMDHDEHGCEPDDQISGLDYISDALDITYYISSDRETCEGARILVAFGGPNIWIDTKFKTVELYWWGDKEIVSYHDDIMGIDDAIDTLWHC
jgi:hypothetical protein